MANIKQLLLKLKLSPKEAAIFLSLVKLGKATATAIARDSGITRTHVYDVVQELGEKGLVSEIEERGIKTYEAVDHAGLLAYITRQQKELVSIEKSALTLASEFNALQLGTQQQTKVRFFNGIDGVQNIYEEIRTDFLKQENGFEILTIFSPENLNKIIPQFQYFSFPNARGRDIVCDDALLPEFQKQIVLAGNGVQHRVWPKDKGLFPTDNIAWANKVAYIDVLGHPSGIIIESVSIYTSFEMWFNGLWEGLK